MQHFYVWQQVKIRERQRSTHFICQEEIKKTEETILYRICIEDIKSKRLFCVKYILFKDSEGKPDIAINTEYTDKLYKI